MKLEPVKASDCADYPALPETHKVRVDLYHCARGECGLCSKLRSPKTRQTQVGGCLFELLEEANELLAILENKERE